MKITVKEKQILHLGVQTFAETNSNTGIQFFGGLRNPLGYGETLVASAATNQSIENRQDFTLQAQFPFVGRKGGALSLSARKSHDRQGTYFSSFGQEFSTLLVEYTSPRRNYRFTGEISQRDEVPFSVLPPSADDSTTSSEDAAPLITGRSVLKSVQKVIGSSVDDHRVPSALVLHSVSSSLKTSLKYWQSIVDSRNSTANPTIGQLLETSVEVALPPGEAQFVKGEVQAQIHVPLTVQLWRQMLAGDWRGLLGHPAHHTLLEQYRNAKHPASQEKNDFHPEEGPVLSLASSIGLMYPLASLLGPDSTGRTNHKKSFLVDRYHLGGPLNLRGFRVSGVGPRAFSEVSDDSLGGDAKRQLLVMLSYPLPKVLPGAHLVSRSGELLTPNVKCPVTRFQQSLQSIAHATQMRGFVFMNAGSIGSPSFWQQQQQQQQEPSAAPATVRHPLFGFLRLSVGGGVSMIFANMIRFEATYSVPVVYGLQTDHVKRFQLGVGVSING